MTEQAAMRDRTDRGPHLRLTPPPPVEPPLEFDGDVDDIDLAARYGNNDLNGGETA